MTEDILTRAGVPFRRTRYTAPPAGTYAVYDEGITADGPDGVNCVFTHDVTVEVYEPSPDDASETAIENAIGEKGLRWTKQDRYWLQDVQRYQVIYEFSYIEKRRI